MKMKLIPFLLLSLTPSLAVAQTPLCDSLDEKAAAVSKDVMNAAYLYDCCDDTIAKCLKQAPECKLSIRLADETCRLAKTGKSSAEIRHILDQRAMTMTAVTQPAKIAIQKDHLWGNKDAKVVLSVYLCGRCPYCSRHVPALIQALETSPLKEKVAINLRLFPIKQHENSTQAALAIEAAAKLDKAWPFLLKLYENFDSFTPEMSTSIAKDLQLDTEKFAALVQDAGIRNAVVTSKKEGLTNQVESTPTFFLNGRKVQGTFDVDSIMSMLEEAAGM